jgi:hypothetical protein
MFLIDSRLNANVGVERQYVAEELILKTIINVPWLNALVCHESNLLGQRDLLTAKDASL